MFHTTSLTTLLLALSVAASPVLVNKSPVTLFFSRRVNATSMHNLVAHDQARAKALQARGVAKTSVESVQRAVISEPVDNQAVSYIASIGVGSPPTTYSLIIDTGSSNTWIGAGTAYVKTSASVKTSNSVSVNYGSGSFSGTEYTDTVTIASDLVIPNQSIGVASASTGFPGVDGILGIGPVDLTLGTLSPATGSLIATVTDNFFADGIISADEIGISFEPTTSPSVMNGELTWGGTDNSKFTGSIKYTTAGIVDTGTTLILLASDGYATYKTATGAVLDSATGLLRITSTQLSALQSLFFTVGGTTFELTANAQLWPRSLNADIGGTTSRIYLVVNDLGSPSGEGLDFINGQTFLERFYSVFDTGNKRVGLATTAFTHATTN